MAVMRALVLLFLVFSVGNAAAHEKCPNGWTPFGVQCYKLFSQSVNWATAEKNCQSVGANLASVHNIVENDFLLKLVSANTYTWIGGHDGEVEGQWLWSDGSHFVFTNWCAGQPRNYGGNENCLHLNYTNNRCWNDEPCSTTMSYICAQPMRSFIMAVMKALVLLFLVFSVENAAAHDCPYGWEPFDVQCYKFFSQSVDWATAEKNCQSVDANLASVRSTVENNFLLSLVSVDTQTWIGGHDGEIEGQWLWSDGSQFDFTNWCSGQPDNKGVKEHCLEISYRTNHCWNDAPCSYKMSYICAQPMRS
nr:C-type lectin lectoxin-Lio3-like [Misgurnus anguillicaudatus]